MKLNFLYKNNIYSFIILITISFAVYWPILSNQFLMLWDDQWVVMNNYTENGFILENLRDVFTEFYHGQYSPVNELFYILLYSIFGYNPFWFHFSCLLIHIANVLLVYIIIYRLLEQIGSFEIASAKQIAFFSSLLFSVHPFIVESVAWVSASKVIIYSLFYLLALNSYLKYYKTLQFKYYLLTLLLFILSFGAKEQAVVMPLCLLLIDFALKRDFRNRNVWLEKLPFFALALFFGIVTMLSQGAISLLNNASYPLYQRLVFASYSLMEYLVKCLVPIKLSYLYPFPNPVGEPIPLRFWSYPIIIIFLIVTLWNFWKQRWIFFGIAFFIIHIIVASIPIQSVC